jgi:hypothetical protein
LNENNEWIYITENDLHLHLKARMFQRGITLQDIEYTLNEGWQAFDAKPGTFGKTMVYSYQDEWEGHFFEEKEVTLYYKIIDGYIILLTAKVRYGTNFSRGE